MTRLIPSNKVIQIERYVNNKCHVPCSFIPMRSDSSYELVLAHEPFRPPKEIGRRIVATLNEKFLMTFNSRREKLVFKEIGLGDRDVSWGISAEVVPCAEQS